MLIEYKYYSRKRQKLQERKSPAKKKEAALPDVCRVFGQCSGAVKTMIDIIGMEKFCQQLRESVNHRDLNPKYKDLKNQMGTSSDGILEYLSERGAL